MEPTKGFRFRHSRVINWDAEKTPALYEVTRIATGRVFYRPVYDAGLPSERLGNAESCEVGYFPKVSSPCTAFPVNSNYRNCAVCSDSFAPITSGADDRYTFCSHSCETTYLLERACK